MLHPKKNRIDYGEQLIPPPGYELTHAIGTTYSLDLEALMLLPVALFYAELLDGEPDVLRYDMLDAITKSAEKITIFYQAGQLKVPHKYHPLIAYWEKGIQPVIMPTHASSFHPKVWIIRYDRKGEPAIYRLLVTSRNLTFDRSWDVAFSTMGYVSQKAHEVNEPLSDLMRHLSKGNKRPLPPSFADDVDKVIFKEPDGIKSLKFLPIGVSSASEAGKRYSNKITQKKWEELLIISPFLDDKTLSTLQNNCDTIPYLLSSKESLDCIDPSLLENFETWQFSTFIESAEYLETLEEGGVEPCDQNLHAKLFVAIKNDKPFWFLGSANCTDPAQERNIEFMAELIAENETVFRPKSVFKSLTESLKSEIPLFTKYDPDQRGEPSEKANIDLAVRRIKYDLTQLSIRGESILIPDAVAYNLKIEIDATDLKLPVGFTVFYKPLPELHKKAVELLAGSISNENGYGGYTEFWLSPYLEFSIFKDGQLCNKFLLEMKIELPGSRLNKIFTSIIDSKEKFLKYLAFILTGEETGVIDPGEKGKKKNPHPQPDMFEFNGAPVFEKLLIAASRHPAKLASVEKLIERIKDETEETGDKIVSLEFEGFWNVFKTYLNSKK